MYQLIINMRKNKRISDLIVHVEGAPPDNHVDKYLIIYLMPIHVVHSIFLLPHYQIWCNRVTPNGYVAKTITLLSSCLYTAAPVLIGIFVRKMHNFPDTPLGNQNYVCTIVTFSIFNLGYIMNLVCVLRNSSSHVTLVATIQRVLRSLDGGEDAVKNILYRSFAFVFIVVVADVCYCIFMYNISHFKIYDLFYDMFGTYFNNVVAHAVVMAMLISSAASQWIEEIKRLKRIHVKNDAVYVRMFAAYSNLLSAYNLFSDVFQDMIIFYVFHTFAHSLDFLQIWIGIIKWHKNGYYIFLAGVYGLGVWFVKQMSVLVALTIQIEKLYILMEETQSVSADLMKSSRCSLMEKRTYKNVLRLYRAQFKKTSARGLFDIDADLPLQMIKVIANYIVVLLQFAFLP